MTEKRRKRILKHARLYLKKDATISSVAKVSGHCKSTVHLDLYRVEEINKELFMKVLEKIMDNTDNKHIKAGEATKKLWEKKNKKKK